MNLTKEDLRDFARFADEKLERGEAGSLVDLAGEWESRRDRQEPILDDIHQSHADIESGRVQSVSDVFADVRKQLGLK